MVRPLRLAVRRDRSGQSRQAAPKTATRPAVIVGVSPAGQVTVPAGVSIAKSSAVKPPRTAARNGIALITAV
jgi:hypothetical protein